MGEPLLLLEGVELLSAEGKPLFKDLNWSLDRGERVRIRPTPGGEASALLRLAVGLLVPQAGRVILGGAPLGPYTYDHPFLKRGGLGWVPSEGGLLVNQTLLQNVALPLMFAKGWSRSSAEATAAEALERVGLSGSADHRPHALDPAERWMGAVVRAGVMEPELWLVWQPAMDLDPVKRKTALSILERAATLVIVGEERWVSSTRALRWESGLLVPGETDAV